MKYLFIVLLIGCNTVKKTEVTSNKINDTSFTTFNTRIQHTSADNLTIKRDNGSWTKTIVYPANPSQGIIVTETGTYNRDYTEKEHKDSYTEYNVCSNYNVYHHINVTTTVTKKSRFAWLPMLFFAIGGVGVFLATRIPIIARIIIALINFVINKFKKKKHD